MVSNIYDELMVSNIYDELMVLNIQDELNLMVLNLFMMNNDGSEYNYN